MGDGYFGELLKDVKDPIRGVNNFGFSPTDTLITILLLVPKVECFMKFYDPENGCEVPALMHRYHWKLHHDKLNANKIAAVRDCGDSYVIKYKLVVDENLSLITEYIQVRAFKVAEEYNLEYRYV